MNPINPKYYGFELGFNQKPSTLMHIDLNSCFATIEQQANPMLRGRPLAVAAYTTPSGCILAASTEPSSWELKPVCGLKTVSCFALVSL
jgi:hypothetical protein